MHVSKLYSTSIAMMKEKIFLKSSHSSFSNSIFKELQDFHNSIQNYLDFLFQNQIIETFYQNENGRLVIADFISIVIEFNKLFFEYSGGQMNQETFDQRECKKQSKLFNHLSNCSSGRSSNIYV